MGNRNRRIKDPTKESQIEKRKEPELNAGTSTIEAAGSGSVQPKCWEFTLVKLEDSAKRAEVGMAIYGLFQASGLLVASNELGILGFVPSEAANKIMRAVGQERRTLTGEILSIGTAMSKIAVQLCLI